ncbi:MAG: universal stress protein [Haloferacaceae archaeon]
MTVTFGHVLVAVDGSEPSRRALRVGLAFADAYDATVEVLHVVATSRAATADERDAEAAREDRRAALRETVAGMSHEADVELRVEEGRPAATISARAEASGADLVALGRHGHGGLGERLLGSVAEKVLRHSDVPVLTTAATEPTAPVGLEGGDVLAPTDGSDAAARAAPYGAAVADRFGARLHVARAVDVQAEAGIFDAGGVSEAYVERLEGTARESIDAYVERVRETSPDVAVERAVLRGRPHEALAEYAAGHDVDLVAIASRGQSSLAGQLLGSVADRVLRVVDVPVLVVPVRD